MRACVCLALVLLLVRWVSVKRITTVSLLYPHTVSKTYIHKTHFPRYPTPHPQSTVEQSIGKPSISFRIWETQRLVTFAQWWRQEWNAEHVGTFPTFTKVWMFLISIQIKNNKHTSTLINMAAVICGWPVPACPKLHIFISFSLTLPLSLCASLYLQSL